MAMHPHVCLEKVDQASVTALAMASERRELFTTSQDRYIKIWNLDDGRLSRTYDAHRGSITSLTWLTHLRMLASSSLDYSVAIWNFKGECAARSKFPCAVYSAGYSAKNDLLVVGGTRRMFILKLVNSKDEWDLILQKTFDEHTDFISQIVCTPSGRIFSCGYDGFICAFEMNVEDELMPMTAGGGHAKAKCHNGAITCATFNTEANTLITGGYDMVVKTWNYDSLTAHATFIPLHTLAFSTTVTCVCYVAATRSVWVGTQGVEAPHIFDPRTGTNLTDFNPQSDLDSAPSSSVPSHMQDCPMRIIASATSEAVTVSDHRTLCIWKYNPLACVSVIRGHTDWVEMVVRNPVSPVDFVSAGADSTVRRWHSPSALYPELYSLKEALEGHQGAVLCGVVKEDGSMLFTAGDDTLIRGWTLDDSMASESAELGVACKMVLQGHDGRVTAVCMLDHYLVSVSVDQSVRIWDANTGTLWKTIEDAHDSAINDVAACPDRDPDQYLFATVGSDGVGYVWELENAALVGPIEGHKAEVSHVEWNAAHQAWVTASEDATLRMWRPDGTPLPLRAARRSPAGGPGPGAGHGSLPVSGGSEEAEAEAVVMKVDSDGFSALAVQPHSGAVLAGLSDSSVLLLDLPREAVLQVYKGHKDLVRSITCIPEKNQLITAGWDHSIRVWLMTPHAKRHTQAPGPNRTASRGDGGGGEEGGEGLKSYAEKFPPLEPLSLKHDRGLARFGKAIEREAEGSVEMTPQQRRERQKQQSPMYKLLTAIEEGDMDAALPRARQSKPAKAIGTVRPRKNMASTDGGGGSVLASSMEKKGTVFQQETLP